jgi:DNA-binding GntR family transcriptional regulator
MEHSAAAAGGCQSARAEILPPIDNAQANSFSVIPKVLTMETVRPILRASLADAVYDTLVEAIVHGRLAPGEELIAVALAARFHVSRTPVTEAIQRLAHDGLVEQSASHKAHVVRLSRDDVVEIYTVRGHLEAAAAERAAKQMPESQLRALREQANRLAAAQQSVDWGQQAIDFDLRFHDSIALASSNRRLAADIARYRRLVRCFCRLTGSEQNLRAAFAEHLKILDALEKHKPAAARKAMVAHVESRLSAVLAELFAETT